jgi:hypothetical protein
LSQNEFSSEENKANAEWVAPTNLPEQRQMSEKSNLIKKLS